MKFGATSPKITPKHLSSGAIVYIRRSHPRQELEHSASGIHQRSFSEMARSFGWPNDQIKVIDLDDGRSATSTTKRKGYQWLRQEVFEGRVGAIFCWEASRLGRDNSDFAQLVKLCAATDTLIIDEKGVYDPNNTHDRIYLGLMSVLYDAESVRIGDRTQATKRAKAEAGQLALRPPVGYVRDDKGKLILDPRKKVQKVLRLFFSMFDKLRSSRQVVKHFNLNDIQFPKLIRSRGKKSEIEWKEFTCERAESILHNIIYAGTYAYGRTKTTNEMLAAEATEQKKKRVHSDEAIIKHGAHEGYITLKEYHWNQKILEENRYGPGFRFKGAAREGSALLQGMVFCGTCLWKLTSRYDSKRGSGSYACVAKSIRFARPVCFSIIARRLDMVVVDAFFDAVSPAQLQLTLRGLEEVHNETRVDDAREQEELENAKAECVKAKRRFYAIGPENTLVFKECEKNLQEKMREVKRLEEQNSKALQGSRPELTEENLRSLLELPQHLRAFWESATTTNVERKQLLRCLISRVDVKRREDSKYQDVLIHWASGAITPLPIIRSARFRHPELVELVRRLAPDHTITQIIDRLHEAGFRPSRAGRERFTPEGVLAIFKSYGIKLTCPDRPMTGDKPRGDGRYSATAVAKMLNVCNHTIYRLCASGILHAIRSPGKQGVYWIDITPEQVSALKDRLPQRVGKSTVQKSKNT
ncbi:MAG: recombinase family protein [Acidobacteria bacterium]|nr:recombinase family protein [Acidobacteriota bacterium]